MNKQLMWKVYPTEYVCGFVPTYCPDRMSAEWEQLKMEIATGVEWRIKAPSVLY